MPIKLHLNQRRKNSQENSEKKWKKPEGPETVEGAGPETVEGAGPETVEGAGPETVADRKRCRPAAQLCSKRQHKHLQMDDETNIQS